MFKYLLPLFFGGPEVFEKKKRIEKATEEVSSKYIDLIQQYKLIQEKKSSLSRKKRDNVVAKINLAIRRGHIKVK